MITIFYSIADGETQEEIFSSDKDANKFVKSMDKRYGDRGWNIEYTERF